MGRGAGDGPVVLSVARLVRREGHGVRCGRGGMWGCRRPGARVVIVGAGRCGGAEGSGMAGGGDGHAGGRCHAGGSAVLLRGCGLVQVVPGRSARLAEEGSGGRCWGRGCRSWGCRGGGFVGWASVGGRLGGNSWSHGGSADSGARRALPP
ncbi:hypothetical protein ACTIVE_3385 [Actinomadura verrucosospora]|uniref:Uncharacterized protein n=1 Tax=Actinomadura verrucosospora TaxID=46165 RepID=A0A7D4A5Y9_ACTVE|nr:hypothetical protein ACTIVE_3385 [Actinomadura verrucosospora]